MSSFDPKGDNVGGIPMSEFSKIQSIAQGLQATSSTGVQATREAIEDAYNLMDTVARAQTDALFPGNGLTSFTDAGAAFTKLKAAVKAYQTNKDTSQRHALIVLLQTAVREWGELFTHNGPLSTGFDTVPSKGLSANNSLYC